MTPGSRTFEQRNVRVKKDVAVGRGTVIHSRTSIQGPAIIGDHCEIGPNAYIGPYTSIGDNSSITYTEIKNSIVMEGAHIECGRRITYNLIGQNVAILSHENNLPKGHRFRRHG